MRPLRGILVPMSTCFDDEYRVDPIRTIAFTEFLVTKGVHGLVPTAGSGEMAHLTDDERAAVWKYVIEAADGRVPVIACTTGNSTEQTLRLSVRAQDLGALAVLISPPYCYGPELTPGEVVGHYRRVAENLSIPIMLHNDPSTVGFDLTPPLVAELSELPNISYIKESSSNVRRCHEIMSLAGERMIVFAGSCAVGLEAFALGVTGWITGLQNFHPIGAVNLFQTCAERNDFATGRQLYFNRILPICRFFASIRKPKAIVKEALRMIGVNIGQPRLPFTPLNDEERSQLLILLEKVGALHPFAGMTDTR